MKNNNNFNLNNKNFLLNLFKNFKDPTPFLWTVDENIWRYKGTRFSTYFNKDLSNYIVSFSLGIKRHICLFLPIFFNFSYKKKVFKEFLDWQQYSFIFENSLSHNFSWSFLKNDFLLVENFINKNLYPVDFFPFHLFLSLSWFLIKDYLDY